MKIKVAVHIPLFNILSVRQSYCLSIGVGVNHRLYPPILFQTYMIARAAFTQLWMRAPRSALCIYAQQKHAVVVVLFGHLFLYIHSNKIQSCIYLQFETSTTKANPDRESFIFLKRVRSNLTSLITYTSYDLQPKGSVLRFRFNSCPCSLLCIP